VIFLFICFFKKIIAVWFLEEINQAWAAKWLIPHYFDMIKKPMDVPTIQRKIATHAYVSFYTINKTHTNMTKKHKTNI